MLGKILYIVSFCRCKGLNVFLPNIIHIDLYCKFAKYSTMQTFSGFHNLCMIT